MKTDLIRIQCDHPDHPHFSVTHLQEEVTVSRGCETPVLDGVCGRPVKVVGRYRKLGDEAEENRREILSALILKMTAPDESVLFAITRQGASDTLHDTQWLVEYMGRRSQQLRTSSLVVVDGTGAVVAREMGPEAARR